MTLSRAEKCCVTANQRFSFYLLSLLWLVASSNVSLANTYYLDPVSGNDSESGTSEQLAWRSFSKVSAQSNDGDTIVLIRFDDSFNDMTWPDRTYRSTSIQQFGFAWSFDRDYRIGRFVNGDYWVAGPVAIVGITPVSTNEGGRVRHGSMINPSPSTNSHGYDTALPNGEYDADLNVAMGVSPEAPLVLSNPCSLVSTESVASSGQRPQIAGAAVLTILDAPAPQGAFRPAYSGSDKSVQHHADQLDYSLLRTLAPVANTPALETVAKYFERPWLDHRGGWLGRYQHPAKNMPDYGREIATQIGIGALMLHLDFSREQKAKLLHRYVQLGIDLYGVLINEGHWNWHNDGGHGGGRKWPILFAGLMLDDSPMKSIGDKSGNYLYQGGYGPGNCPPDYVHFGEDDQTFYVAQFDVDITNGPKFKPDSRDAQQFPYTTADIGLPEWAIRHSTSPQASNKWLPTKYRAVAGPPFNGLALPALLMDAKELWNNDAFFDYTDRYMAFSAPGGAYAGYWRSNSTFTANMWDTYRAQCGPVWSGIEVDPDPETPPDDGSGDGDTGDADPPETDPDVGADPPVDEPPYVELVEPCDGDIVSGLVAIEIEATDAEDAPGMLLVEIGIDSDLWLEAVYDTTSGRYAVQWDSADWADGLGHTIEVRATDHAPQENTTCISPITVVVKSVSTMHVASVTVFQVYLSFAQRRVQAVVAVVDSAGDPVDGALVTGTFEGGAVESVSGETNGFGLAILAGPEGATTFHVGEVTHPDYAYRPDQNAANSGSAF